MDTTDAVEAHAAGNRGLVAQIIPPVYRELRKLAANYLRRERPDHTLQPTALVHEAYLRLVDNSRISWQGKSHFRAIAAGEMRRVLVEHARQHGAQKRGGGLRRITFEEGVVPAKDNALDPLVIDELLNKLHELSPRQAQVAELRFFAGMNVKETACFLDVSERTVKEDWRVARAWLRLELERSSGERLGPGTP